MVQIIGLMVGTYCLARLFGQLSGGPGWVARIAAAIGIVGVGMGMLLLVALEGMLPTLK